LIQRALAFQPEVIHCFKPKSYSGLALWGLWHLKRLSRLKARLIVDTDDWEGWGGWNDKENYSWTQKRLFAWQEQWCLRQAEGVTIASRALESIVWSLGVKPPRTIYVPNGIGNLEDVGLKVEASSPTSNLQPPAPTILLYTRFVEFKVERVLDVLQRVIAQVPEAKLLILGQGLHHEEDELLMQAEALGLRAHVEYAGWVKPEELAGLFARSTVAIHLFDDTLINRTKCSVKLIDLLAAGVPVVADAVGQNTEYIQPDETGLLVPSGDAAAMAEAVAAILHHPIRRKQLSSSAARDVRERFNWDRLIEAVEKIYQGDVTR
jgi:glycosyltransferase involved in cell wall biosynthesis